MSTKVYHKEETNLGVLIRAVPWKIISINKGKQILTKDPYEDNILTNMIWIFKVVKGFLST